MKERLNIINANIDNLTSLWKSSSIPFQSYYSDSKFSYCYIENSDWPNKLWLNQDVDQEIIPLIKEKILSISVPLIIPYWDIYENNFSEDLEEQGFTKLFEQVGMSLKISKPLKTQDNLNIQLVSNNSQTNLWAKLFEMSFGYKIPEEILLETKNEIDYYIAYTQNQAVGTAISYRTNNIMGIHSVGIPPEIRRKGYAEQIMKLLINSAVEDNCDYMTLQASDMGKNLYLSLGFKEQFIIKNYKLQ